MDIRTWSEMESICSDYLNDAERLYGSQAALKALDELSSIPNTPEANHAFAKRHARRLASKRFAAGMTQKELSEKSGVNIRQIQKAESGESSLKNMAAKNVIAIADALGIDPHELM
jgi:ribosome-binding protein aMBF1 (putative translation factor)